MTITSDTSGANMFKISVIWLNLIKICSWLRNKNLRWHSKRFGVLWAFFHSKLNFPGKSAGHPLCHRQNPFMWFVLRSIHDISDPVRGHFVMLCPSFIQWKRFYRGFWAEMIGICLEEMKMLMAWLENRMFCL